MRMRCDATPQRVTRSRPQHATRERGFAIETRTKQAHRLVDVPSGKVPVLKRVVGPAEAEVHQLPSQLLPGAQQRGRGRVDAGRGPRRFRRGGRGGACPTRSRSSVCPEKPEDGSTQSATNLCVARDGTHRQSGRAPARWLCSAPRTCRALPSPWRGGTPCSTPAASCAARPRTPSRTATRPPARRACEARAAPSDTAFATAALGRQVLSCHRETSRTSRWHRPRRPCRPRAAAARKLPRSGSPPACACMRAPNHAHRGAALHQGRDTPRTRCNSPLFSGRSNQPTHLQQLLLQPVKQHLGLPVHDGPPVRPHHQHARLVVLHPLVPLHAQVLVALHVRAGAGRRGAAARSVVHLAQVLRATAIDPQNRSATAPPP